MIYRKESIKVAYDIDFLGLGYASPKDRTGIFRVVEHVAEILVEKKCDVHFFAQTYANEADTYLNNDSKLRPYLIELIRRNNTSYINEVNHFLRQVGKKSLQSHYNGEEKAPLLGKIFRKAVFSVQSFMPPLRDRIEVIKIDDLNILRKVNVYHSPFSKITDTVRSFSHLKCFLTVYDLIPILYPQYLNLTGSSWTHEAIASLRPKDWVFTISQATKDDLCEYRKDLHPSQVIVTHLAASPDKFYRCTNADELQAIRNKYHLPENAKYFLALSNLAPHKNFAHLLKCFDRLIRQENLSDVYLILVGSRAWQYEDIFERVRSSKELSKRVIFTGRVQDPELPALYSGATGFVFPSLYEGFGLPPLEAMQCGVPVITSNTSSLPEVVGRAGIMVNPTDEDALCQAMLSVYQDSVLRDQLAKKSLEQAAKFSWQKCVQQVIKGYRTALNS
jgi:glycosyltransferase involved in cell wall biosynthesis